MPRIFSGMIKSYNPYLTIIIIAFAALIIMAVAANLFLGGIKDAETVKKLSVYAKTTGFIFFLVIGFSAVPVLIKFFADTLIKIIPDSALPKSIQENGMTIVYIFWVVYIFGLIIAIPAAQKAGFFTPEPPAATPQSGRPSAKEPTNKKS